MSYLPESASFEELVQDYFVAFRGRGLMLSPLDGELASAWAQVGVPFEVVARGIRRAAEGALRDARPGESGLWTLRACRRAVEAEIKKFQDRSAGAPDPAAKLQEDREKKRRAKLRRFTRDHPERAELLERAAARAERQPPEGREEAVLLHALRLLPYPERVGLYREARVHCASQEALSARARRLARRFHVAVVVRRALCLPSFW
ncbi:MAG TPA: hypothetical protein VFB81_00385 [Myxococcales bacterium]|nr:hypothetical protein [Myxococcales bacterium]